MGACVTFLQLLVTCAICCYFIRVKRGRGAVGSRMDEPGPYLHLLFHHKDEPSPDIRVEEKWERRVQGPEKPSFLRSKSPDDYWQKALDRKQSSSEPQSKKEKKRRSEKKDKGKR